MIIQFIQRLRRSEHGSSLVLLVMAMFALIAITALVVDGLYAYSQYRRIQTAADAAAVAAAREVYLGNGKARPDLMDKVVAQYAQANGADSWGWDETTDGPYGANTHIVVTTTRTFNTFFAYLLGGWSKGGGAPINSFTTSAYSEATISPAGSSSGLLPFTRRLTEPHYGETYVLWEKSPDKDCSVASGSPNPCPGSGNFGWLDWDDSGGGATQLADNIQHPERSGTWRIGDKIPVKTGVVASSQVQSALNMWMYRHFTIPLWSEVETPHGDNMRYVIGGFAEFVLTDFCMSNCKKDDSGAKWIKGYMTKWIRDLEPNPQIPDNGIKTIRFTQ